MKRVNKILKQESCFKNCSGNGECVDGKCICDEYTTGIFCEKSNFSLILGRCKNDCFNNGECSAGFTCTCNKGFSGEDCSNSLCPKNCNFPYGDCTVDGCKCSRDFIGEDCSLKKCPNDCSGNGECDFQTGLCKCNQGFKGKNCNESIYSISKGSVSKIVPTMVHVFKENVNVPKDSMDLTVSTKNVLKTATKEENALRVNVYAIR